MKLKFFITSLLLLIMTMPANAQSDAAEAAAKGLAAVTVFIDTNKLTRKHTAARKMTRSHQDFAAHGYQLVDVTIYTENGDLEGFFVSYRKTAD